MFRSATEEEIKSFQANGSVPNVQRVALDMTSCITKEELHTNFFQTLERGFKPITPYLNAYKGKCSLVGAGPSIEKTYKEIDGDVISVNSAIWFLLEHGVVPKFHMIWDGCEVCEKFAIPHPEITYLIASRCHPRVFEKLKGCNVVVWHSGGDHDISEVMGRPDVQSKIGIQPLISGGSAGVTRGIFLAKELGYRDIQIFGGDSSYSNGKTHVMGSVVPEKDMMVSLGDGTPGAPQMWFRTTPEWCAQINEYRIIYALFSVQFGLNIEVHGGGLLGELHQRLKDQRATLGDEEFFNKLSYQALEQQERDMQASKFSQQLEAIQ